MNLDAATAIIGTVIIVINGAGALWNSGRFDKLKDSIGNQFTEMREDIGDLRERMARIETAYENSVSYSAERIKRILKRGGD